jgi:hypothetical protein
MFAKKKKLIKKLQRHAGKSRERKKGIAKWGYIANKKNSDGRPNPVPLPES